MSKPFGIDVSEWQGNIDWKLIAERGKNGNEGEIVEFAFIKASQRDDYQDPRFEHNWIESQRNGIPRGAYHYVESTSDPKKQVSHFVNVVKSVSHGMGDFPLVLDFEMLDSLTIQQRIEHTKACVAAIEDITGKPPIIYSRGNWIDDYLTGIESEWLNKYDWWIANYLKSGKEHPGPPILPKGLNRERCIVHQTSDHTPAIAGIGSKMLDYNRWQGDLESLYTYINQNEPDPDDPPLDDEKPVNGLRMAARVDKLKVRSGPGARFPVIERLKLGDVVNVLDVEGEEVWIKISDEPEKWVDARWLGRRYLERVDA